MSNFVNCNAIVHDSHGGYYGFCQVNSLETAIQDAQKAFPSLPKNGAISFPVDGKPYFESNNRVYLQL